MNCTSCPGQLAVAPSGSLARCGSCGNYFGLMAQGPMPIVVTGPWPLRTRDEQEDEAEDQAFETATTAPSTSPLRYLKFIIPVVVLVVGGVIVLSVVLSMQSEAPPPEPTKAPAKTAPAKTTPAKKN